MFSVDVVPLRVIRSGRPPLTCAKGIEMEAGVRDPWNPGEAFVPECPLCSGKVARDDPGAQALDWGVRTAEANGEESEFWKVTQAIGAYRDAASLGGAIAIDEYVDAVGSLNSESLSVLPSGM